MASGCVIRYDGVRGSVFRIKYVDASGKQVQEVLGKAKSRQKPDGWTKSAARKELRKRLAAVEQDGYMRPTPETFRTFVDGWVDGGKVRASQREVVTRGPAEAVVQWEQLR